MTGYGMILADICALDLTATLIGLKVGWWSGEANPLLAWFLLRWGLTGLACAKIFLSAAAISILEIIYHSGKIPRQKIINYMRFAIVAYVVMFVGALLLQII